MSKPVELRPYKSTWEGPPSWTVDSREWFNLEAKIAIACAERWALVAAIPDGEDSSGRQKLRLPTPQELAERSAGIASALYEEFDTRGWMIPIPSGEDAEAAWAEKRKREKANDPDR